MAQVNIQNAVDRIAVKTKELVEALKAINTTQDASITALQQATTALQASINEVKAKTVQKQIDGNVDFTTLQDLKQLINDDEFIAITFASGVKVTGRAIDAGTGNPNDPIIISGWRTENNVDHFGQITIDQNLAITGGVDITTLAIEANHYTKVEVDALIAVLAKLDLSNIDLGSANSGKVLTVSASGGIELKTISVDPIIIFEGEEKIFIKEKTGTKFEDTNLFDKHLIADEQALVGGTDGSSTNGEVISHTHIVAKSDSAAPNGADDDQARPNYLSNRDGNNKTDPVSQSTGGTKNKAYGIKLLKVIYIAKKDIKESEML